MAIYDGFNDWSDVADQFTDLGWGLTGKERKKAALVVIPEPEEVLVAAYNQEPYEGDAWVVYRNIDKYFEVSGSHCSCNGLEGQWEPESYDSASALLDVLEKRKKDYGAQGHHLSHVKQVLAERLATETN